MALPIHSLCATYVRVWHAAVPWDCTTIPTAPCLYPTDISRSFDRGRRTEKHVRRDLYG